MKNFLFSALLISSAFTIADNQTIELPESVKNYCDSFAFDSQCNALKLHYNKAMQYREKQTIENRYLQKAEKLQNALLINTINSNRRYTANTYNEILTPAEQEKLLDIIYDIMASAVGHQLDPKIVEDLDTVMGILGNKAQGNNK